MNVGAAGRLVQVLAGLVAFGAGVVGFLAGSRLAGHVALYACGVATLAAFAGRFLLARDPGHPARAPAASRE